MTRVAWAAVNAIPAEKKKWRLVVGSMVLPFYNEFGVVNFIVSILNVA
jgi:hypothetical protein